MKIHITGCKYTPRWETLQKVICQCLDTDGRIVRIKRDGCNYRAPGDYEVDFQTDSEIINIELKVQ